MTSAVPANDRPAAEPDLWALARRHLGPASEEALVRRPDVLARAAARVDAGVRPLDAVLKEIHALIGEDPLIENEFARYILPIAMRVGRLSMPRSSRLRRFLNTGDLADSVLGNLWPDLSRLEFESEARFAALLASRMTNKARDHAKRLSTRKRSEHLRAAGAPDQLAAELSDDDPASDPVARAIQQEQVARLALILDRLAPRDREVLVYTLKGLTRSAIAERLDMSYDAVRMALRRAIDHARALGGSAEP